MNPQEQQEMCGRSTGATGAQNREQASEGGVVEQRKTTKKEFLALLPSSSAHLH